MHHCCAEENLYLTLKDRPAKNRYKEKRRSGGSSSLFYKWDVSSNVTMLQKPADLLSCSNLGKRGENFGLHNMDKRIIRGINIRAFLDLIKPGSSSVAKPPVGFIPD